MPRFQSDLAQQGTALPHVWSRCVGSGHALLALRADWRRQLRRAREEIGVESVRFHGIFDDDVGTMVIDQDQAVYSFYNAEQIYDGILEADVRPFVELGFMPAALRSGTQTVFHYAANVTPPRDMDGWVELVERFTKRLIERYGAEEVRRWHFEVWNEPNLRAFWTGTQDDYFELYRHTVETLKRVDGGLRVGGPATASNAWIEDFVAFCEREGLPADFVSTHQYPTDALGMPGDDTEQQLIKSTRGILEQNARDVVRQAKGRPVIYTEWSTSSNPFFHRHDEPYAAAFVARTCLNVAGVVEGFSYWTFSDIFEENYFSSVPFHGGFGLLTIHGIPKPTYRAFELMHHLGDERLLVDGLHHTVDCFVVRGADRVSVFLTNHALPGHTISDETVEVRLVGATGSWSRVRGAVERIDETHANARRLWEAMGEPDGLLPDQVDALEEASRLVAEPVSVRCEGDELALSLPLPAHAVACVTLRPSN